MKNQTDAVYCAQGPSRLSPTGEGDLSGLHFVFKDLFDVEGYVTGAGNPSWLKTHSKARSTSPVISGLLSHGAECVGRVQTDELAYSLNGQNIHYGTPVNPKAPDCIPGGSSSGSAVSVAGGDADFAIGTDTGGSVRVPASYCGIFGLRPTLGKFSLTAAFELSKSFDTAGLFARHLSVLKNVYQALSNTHEDAYSKTIACAVSLNDPSYVVRVSEFSDAVKKQGIELLEMKDDVLLADLDYLSKLFRTIQGYEIIQKHGSWLSDNESSIDPAIADRVCWSRSIRREEYEQGLAEREIFRTAFLARLAEYGGVLLLPTTPAGPPRLNMVASELAEYRSKLMGLTAIAGLSGCPQLHIPMLGMEDGPCGVSLLGLPDTELTLINTATYLVGEGEGL